MENEIKIESVNLFIGKKKIELTIQEAKKLKETLETLFGKEIIKEVHHEHHYDWWYYKPVSIKYETKTEPFITFNATGQNSLDITL